MIAQKSIIIILGALLVCTMLVFTASAQDTLLISYQGQLTDAAGEPITGNPAITFTIYTNGGVSKWSEEHSSVPVNNGLFSVILGSQEPLQDSVFNGEDRYLGIRIEGDVEIDPRTLLTSSPGAAVSRRVAGDIKTAPGILEIHSSDPCVPPDPCEPALEMIAEPDKNIIRVHPPEPCVPPEPCDPAIEIASTMEHHSITINIPPPDDGRPAIKLLANNENMIELYYPDAESDEGIVQIGANEAEGGFIELHAADSLTLTRVMMGGSTTDTGFVRLYGGGSETEYKLLELSSHTNLGGSIKFFDPENIDGREMLRIGGSPDAAGGAYRDLFTSGSKLAGGIGIYGFNPQPEPPGHVAFELTSEQSQGGRLAVYGTNDFRTEIIGNRFSIFKPPPDDSQPSIRMSVNAVDNESWLSINNYDALDSAPGMVMSSSSANSILTVGWFIPPPDDNSPPPDGSKPVGSFNISSTTGTFELHGDESALGSLIPIYMSSNGSGVRMGIGTDSPSNELYVVGDITATGAITELSSIKYKTNINRMSNALEKVQELRGVNFDWRTDEFPEMRFSEDQQVGLIAEEVEKIIPQLVHADDSGEKSVDYSKLSAVLIEAIKDQQKLIEELSNRVDELEGKKISDR